MKLANKTLIVLTFIISLLVGQRRAITVGNNRTLYKTLGNQDDSKKVHQKKA